MTSTKAEPRAPLPVAAVWQNIVKRVFQQPSGGGDSGMIDYKARVEAVFTATDEAVSVLNGTPSHARVVFEQAFDHATDRVRILAHDVDCDAFSSAVANAADRFMRRGGSLELMVECEPSRATPMIATLVRRHENVHVRLVSDEMQCRYKWNAMTVDGKAFRFQADRMAMMAVVSGGGEYAASARHLDEQLDIIADASSDLDLTALCVAVTDSVHRLTA